VVSKSSQLRYIRPSGGLFTENILIRLRDNPEHFEIGKIQSFIEEDTKEERKRIQEEKKTIFEWCKDKWDEISSIIDNWTKEELVQRWLMPLFYQFGYVLQEFKLEEEEQDDTIDAFIIDYHTQEGKNPCFHFADVKEDFDSKNKRNPQNKSNHNICQQFINSTSKIKWLFLCNGKILRILTKYYHTYSKGYIEFDLENIFANRDIVEFNTLYSIIHSSRYKSVKETEDFLIELFQEESNKDGVKIGDSLRDNVRKTIDLLGNELIDQNKDFIIKVSNNEVDTSEYYAELLMIIYRILFVLYAEQREMLPGSGSLYFEEFSLSSIRSQAEKPIKGDSNYDLWKKLFLTFELMRKGNDFLEVPSYNGGLFKDEKIPIILNNNLKISNDVFLKFIRLLTTSEVNNVLQRINFLEISEEEIGAIYESLLDYKPIIDRNANFRLVEGTERKSTGSYYTPKELIDILIRTTLQPLVDDRLEIAGNKREDKEKAILDLKICDPACGGGTFLLAALDYLGKILAEIRSDSDTPSKKELRESRREILQNCIYGVDINPLAVELAKISLWLRACVKDKPLSFLDNHIKNGDSLVGFGRKIEMDTINPNGFLALKGNKKTGIPEENSSLQMMARKRIEKEIKEQMKSRTLDEFISKDSSEVNRYKFQNLIKMPEDSFENITKKEKIYLELINEQNYKTMKTIANICVSVFFWKFDESSLGNIPNNSFINHLRNGIQSQQLKDVIEKSEYLSRYNKFFHWNLEFPEVFTDIDNGFDCILTNPPWEEIQFNTKEFFLGINNEIVNASKSVDRDKMILELKEKNPRVFEYYMESYRKLRKFKNYLVETGFFKNTAQGKINTYSIFIERCYDLINPKGYMGIIVPSGFLTHYYLKDMFNLFVKNNSINCIFEFDNKEGIFNIHRATRFCLLSITGKEIKKENIPMIFNSTNPKEVQEPLSIISQKNVDIRKIIKNRSLNKIILFNQDNFKLFNSNTKTCPIFSSKMDYMIAEKIYKNCEIILNKEKPYIKELVIHRMFNMSDDSDKFLEKVQVEDMTKKTATPIRIDSEGNKRLPIYESKFIWIYDYRYAGFENCSLINIKKGNTKRLENKNIDSHIEPRYWIKEQHMFYKTEHWQWKKKWFLAVRQHTHSKNRRTCIATIIPNYPSVYTLNLILNISAIEAIFLVSNLNSFTLDFVARQKISGSSLKQYVLEQLPIVDFDSWIKYNDIIIPKCIELIYTSPQLKDFALELGINREPYEWDESRRSDCMAELDAIYALLYKINKEELEYILDSFPIIRERDIEKFGFYKTKDLILSYFDKYEKIIK